MRRLVCLPSVRAAPASRGRAQQERIDADRAALYRLNGDLNPLHVDPARARAVGFDRPILHGLCTMGVSVKHVMQKYSRDDPATIKTVKVSSSSMTAAWQQLLHRITAEGSCIITCFWSVKRGT